MAADLFEKLIEKDQFKNDILLWEIACETLAPERGRHRCEGSGVWL